VHASASSAYNTAALTCPSETKLVPEDVAAAVFPRREWPLRRIMNGEFAGEDSDSLLVALGESNKAAAPPALCTRWWWCLPFFFRDILDRK